MAFRVLHLTIIYSKDFGLKAALLISYQLFAPTNSHLFLHISLN